MLKNSDRRLRGHSILPLLKARAKSTDLEGGLEIHAEVARLGLLRTDIYVGTALIDMYAKCSCITKAHEVFNTLSFRDVTTWNALISGYTDAGHGKKALECFGQMQRQGVSPNAVTYVCSLKACGTIGASDKGEEIHTEIQRKRLLLGNPYVCSSLVAMYAKCGLLSKAQHVVESFPACDVVSWTALISGYTEHGRDKEALACFWKMQRECVSANAVTFVSALKACANTGDATKGREIHALVDKEGLIDRNIFVGSALVDMYAKCGLTANAQEVFDELPDQNVIAWTSLISGYAEHGDGEKALDCFEQMQIHGILPNAVTFVSSLKACCSIGAIGTLVDMYAKCGFFRKAQSVFKKLHIQDMVLWNALIAGYSEHGCNVKVLDCYKQMQLEGMCPDSITFVCSLKACGVLKAYGKGKEIHCQVKRLGLLEKDSIIGSTLIDMYAKCGLLSRAHAVFNEIQNKDVVCWTNLIAGYSEYGYGKEALGCYEEMQLKGIVPDPVTIVCGLKACGIIGAIEKGLEMHVEIIRRSLLETSVVISSSLIDMYNQVWLNSQSTPSV